MSKKGQRLAEPASPTKGKCHQNLGAWGRRYYCPYFAQRPPDRPGSQLLRYMTE